MRLPAKNYLQVIYLTCPHLCLAINPIFTIICVDKIAIFVRWSHLLCHNWFACKQLISAKIALGLSKLISLGLKRISADKYKAWILMMHHAGELQKTLHNHPFTWNKQTTFSSLQGAPESMSAAILAFRSICCSFPFTPHMLAQALGRTPVGSVGFRMPSVVTLSHTVAAVHARSCLFISAWRRMLMLIDFLKAYAGVETRALLSHLSAHQRDPHLLSARASPPGRCGCYHVSRRLDSAIVNNRLWRKYTDHSTDCIAHVAKHVTGLCI